MMKRKILTTLSAAIVSSLFLSQTVAAAPYTRNITQGDVIITKEQCGDNCPGHKISGTTGTAGYSGTDNKIVVQSGNHKITLSDVKIDTSKVLNTCAFAINPGCAVDLTLEGNSSMKSADGWAGIYVPDKAVLNITKESTGSLSAVAGDSGAGIGGCKNDTAGISGAAGTINIYGGTIDAKGGKFGAGIGGSSEGGAGNITIDGEDVKVTATGGGTPDGGAAAGIGGGSLCDIKKNGGSLAINNGDVTAIGGKGGSKTASDIACSTLSSVYGKQVVIHAALDDKNLDKSQFNGIAWKNDKLCYVYGSAIIQAGQFTLEEGKVMVLGKGNSLTLPPDWSPYGIIAATPTAADTPDVPLEGGAIINGDIPTLQADGKLAGNFEGRVSLTKDDIVVMSSNYTGGDLLTKLVPLPEYRTVGEITKKIDLKGWTYLIDKDPKIKTIVNAKVYEVELCHPIHTNIKTTVTISPCPMDTQDNGAVKYTFDPSVNIYTGEALKPGLTLMYNNITLVPGTDYLVPPVYADNVDVGTAKVTVTGQRNFTGTKEIGFKIEPATIKDAIVTLAKPSVEYNGEQQDPGITVKLGEDENPLNAATEYDVKFLKAGTNTEAVPKDAGKYKIQINGKGNYTGTVEADFEIKPIELAVTNVTAESEKKIFDGTADIKIINVNLDMTGVLPVDADQVSAPASREKPLDAKLDGSAKGIYTTANFEAKPCIGTRGHNYLMVPAQGKATLNPAVTIVEQQGPAVSEIKITYEESPNYLGAKFRCTVNAQPEGVVYEYSMDSENAWQGSNMFDNIVPGSHHTFYVRAKAVPPNVGAGDTKPAEFTFEKLQKDQPGEFSFEYVRNTGEASFTATIPYIEGAVYAFSEEDQEDLPLSSYTTSRTKTDCKPNTDYTAYVKYLGNDIYQDSLPAKFTKTAPPLKVERPLIKPDSIEDKWFLSEKEVTITCGTEGAKIYYTIDGKNPSTEDGKMPSTTSKEYTGPFKVYDTTKVSAVAFYDGMDSSPLAEFTYQKAGDKELGTMVEKELGTDKFVYTEELTEAGFGTSEADKSIEQEMTLKLNEMGYNWNCIAFYEVKLKIGVKDKNGEVKKWEDATIENFPIKGGKGNLVVQMDCPEGTTTATHDFAVCHMFSQSAERLGVTKEMVGTMETPKVTEKDGKLQFTLTSTSPLAIAWKETKGANNNNNNNNNPSDPNADPNAAGKDGQNDPNNGDVLAGNDGTDGTNGGSVDLTGTDGTGGNGANGTAGGNDANGGKDLKSMLAPITGDSAEIVVWAVLLAGAIIAVIVAVKKRKR